jgi:hypothetical protein
MSVISLLNSTAWFIIGLNVMDFFITIPCALGIALAMIQVGLVAFYGKPKKKFSRV